MDKTLELILHDNTLRFWAGVLLVLCIYLVIETLSIPFKINSTNNKIDEISSQLEKIIKILKESKNNDKQD